MTYHPKWMLKNVYDTDEDNVIDWKALQVIGVRQSVLQNFSNPKVLIATSSMNEVLNSADLNEAQAGNIYSDSQELTIIGGTTSANGASWVYWDLPINASKIYTKAYLKHVEFASDESISIDYGDVGNNYWYQLKIINLTTLDFNIRKIYGGGSNIAEEAVDLSADTWYLVEFYWEVGNLKAWRDNVKKFDVNDSDITQINEVRINVWDASGGAQHKGKVKGDVIIIYE